MSMPRRALLAAAVMLSLCACDSGGVKVLPTAYAPWQPLPARYLYPLPPMPDSPIPVPAGSPECRASQLEGQLIGKFGALGSTDTPVVIRNRSDTACFVQGYADVVVVDAKGRQLARAVGDEDRGTYFDNASVPVRVLMQVGTPAFTKSMAFDGGVALSRGQAYLNVEWYGCSPARATTLLVELPDRSGTVVIPYAVAASYSSSCGNPELPSVGVSRGPLDPAGFAWPPPPRLVELAMGVAVPAAIHRGATLDYYVTIRNRGPLDYSLAACPDYTELLLANQAAQSFQLNCGPVGDIAPGSAATFEMRLEIPSTVAAGPNVLTWALGDGRVDPSYASVSIRIA